MQAMCRLLKTTSVSRCDKLIQSISANSTSIKMTPVTEAIIFVKEMASENNVTAENNLQPSQIISKVGFQVPKPLHGLVFLSRSVPTARLHIREQMR